MPLVDVRKWWHTKLRILDRQGLEKTWLTTVNPLDPNDNLTTSITGRGTDCSAEVIPPRAWDAGDSPGYFVYRPTLADLGVDLGGDAGNYEIPQSIEDVQSINKRYIFEYQLLYAYDSTDADCTTIGPPDTHSSEVVITEQDTLRGAVFLFPQIPYIENIGCCDIALPDPGSDLSPGAIIECYRIWNLVESGGSINLYSWDFSETPGSELVDRGVIGSSGIGTLDFSDIAWDDRNKLWGLEVNGLRQIMSGSASVGAVALNYATVNDSFNGDAVAVLFPISEESSGSPGMAFNQNNNHLYISANGYFFELEKISDAIWNITRYQQIGGDVRDLAFDPYNRCFCIYNNNLARIDFSTAFGSLTQVTQDDSFSDVTGLDFLLDFDQSQFVNLYAVETSGQIYEVDTTTGAKTLLGGSTFGATSLGMTGCQAGEDARVPSLPFDAGSSPWIFMLQRSGSMTEDKWNTVTDGMVAFLQNNVVFGDEMVIVPFAEGNQLSNRFVFNTDSDTDEAIAYIQDILSPSGQANFCANGRPMSSIFFGQFQGIKSVVVIGDGNFIDCFATEAENRSHFNSVIQSAKDNGNPDMTVRAVGINPLSNGRMMLTWLGEEGGGGYTEWA